MRQMSIVNTCLRKHIEQNRRIELSLKYYLIKLLKEELVF